MDTAPDGVIKPLFSAGAIATRVDQLASEIATTRLNDLMVVAVLKGSFIFAADSSGRSTAKASSRRSISSTSQTMTASVSRAGK